jgi:Tfp pilus assembly protein PilN
MERVNLIPDDLVLTWHEHLCAFVDRHFLPTVGSLLAAVGLFQLLLAVSHGMLAHRDTRRAATLEAQRATLLAELEHATAYVSQLDQAEGQLKQQLLWLTHRISYLNAYRATEGVWASTLQTVKRTLPYGVWLTELEGTAQGQLRLAGGAFNDDLVSRFMGELKMVPQLTDVAFTYTKQDRIGKTGIVAFEITCHVVTSERTPQVTS